MRKADERLVNFWDGQLKERPLVLDEQQRLVALEAVLGVCRYRGWNAHAVHVRSTHVHTVVAAADVKPEKMLTDFKSYASRRCDQRRIVSGGGTGRITGVRDICGMK